MFPTINGKSVKGFTLIDSVDRQDFQAQLAKETAEKSVTQILFSTTAIVKSEIIQVVYSALIFFEASAIEIEEELNRRIWSCPRCTARCNATEFVGGNECPKCGYSEKDAEKEL